MRNIAPKLCGLLRKPKLGKIFVNQKLKLHNGACHSSHYANIMILTLIALFVTKPTPLRTPRISGLKSQILKPPFLS